MPCLRTAHGWKARDGANTRVNERNGCGCSNLQHGGFARGSSGVVPLDEWASARTRMGGEGVGGWEVHGGVF